MCRYEIVDRLFTANRTALIVQRLGGCLLYRLLLLRRSDPDLRSHLSISTSHLIVTLQSIYKQRHDEASSNLSGANVDGGRM